MTDVDNAIAKYRRRVQAEADLAESDLDELEEHLRELIEELRTTGMPAVEAVTEAARRLGDPRQLAREHARVRSQFGVPLSAARAWSAALIFAVPLIVGIVGTIGSDQPGLPVSWRYWVQLGGFVLVLIALAARRPWARGVVLGMIVYILTHVLAQLLLFPSRYQPAWAWLVEVGVLAFVLPWRRKEISPAAIVLALQVLAYGSAAWGEPLFFEAYETNLTIAAVGAAAAGFGTVLRARWTVSASAISALALFGVAFSELGELAMSRHEFNHYWLDPFATVATGAMAASIAAILGWRTTRSPDRSTRAA